MPTRRRLWRPGSSNRNTCSCRSRSDCSRRDASTSRGGGCGSTPAGLESLRWRDRKRVSPGGLTKKKWPFRNPERPRCGGMLLVKQTVDGRRSIIIRRFGGIPALTIEIPKDGRPFDTKSRERPRCGGMLVGICTPPGLHKAWPEGPVRPPGGSPWLVARTSAPEPGTEPRLPFATLIPATSVRCARRCREGRREIRRGDGGREGARGLRRVPRQAPEGRAERESNQSDPRLRREGSPPHLPALLLGGHLSCRGR